MKRKGFTWIEALVVIGIICILAAILFPVFARSHGGEHRAGCFSNLKKISLALNQYSQDYDNAYPRIAVGAGAVQRDKYYPNGVYGWVDALEPYTKSLMLFQCPSEKNWSSSTAVPQKNGYTDYWLNSRLASTNSEKLKNPASIILLGDGNDVDDLTDATYSYGSLPGTWIRSTTSPAYRHDGKANYVFMDGHVKALRPTEITADEPSGKNYTFRIQ